MGEPTISDDISFCFKTLELRPNSHRSLEDVKHDNLFMSKMADLFVALPPATALSCVLFGKNSNRPASEVQDVISYAAKDFPSGDKVMCTYIEVDQILHTNAVILSKPARMWGAEMGANDKGVAMGNASVYTKVNEPQDSVKRLLGTDIVRLVLERSSSAREGVDVIAGLLTTYGQGGLGTNKPGQEGWSHGNSFLIADSSEAWIVETVGQLWAAERINEGVRNISNELTITTKLDLTSPGLIEEAIKLGLYAPDKGTFDFKSVFCAKHVSDTGPFSNSSSRYQQGKRLLEKTSDKGKLSYKALFGILRDKEGGICMMDGGFITGSSQVSVLLPKCSNSLDVHWFTATPNPTTSIYKPFFFGPGADVGNLTLSPLEDASAEEGESGHALYKGHQRFTVMMDNKEEKGLEVLKQMREFEDICCEDVDQIIENYSEESFPKLRQIFHHMVSMELNFYV